MHIHHDGLLMSDLARVSEGLWLAVAIAAPLALNPWGMNVFELPKTLLLRALVVLLGLAALAQLLAGKTAPFRRPAIPLLGPALGWGLVLLLATVFSVNPRVSLWGSYERQQGLFTLGAYLALFLITAASLRTRQQIERLWSALAWGSVPVVAYCLVQAVGLDPLDWRIDTVSPVISTLGRSNFVGSYLIIVIPLTAGRLLAVRRRWPYSILLAGQLVCLALTQARGAWLGLGAAGVVFALVWATAVHSRRLVAGTLAVAVVALGFVALLNLPAGPLAPLARLPGLDRLATLAHTDAGSPAARLTIWQTAVPLIAARPWLGYGPDTLPTVFARVFPPQLVYYLGRDFMVDRAHNLWLDLGLSTGLAGAAAFGALVAGFGWLAWRGLRTAVDRQECIIWASLAAAVAGHLVDLQFGFDLTASATVFWLTLAFASATSPLPVFATLPAGSSAHRLLILPPALVGLSLIWLICLRPLLADIASWRAEQVVRPLGERLADARQAVRLWPLEPEYRQRLAWAYAQAGTPSAEEQMSAAERLSPNDAHIWVAWGDLYAGWGRYAEAETAYRQALALAPNVAAYHTAFGLALAQHGRLEAGVAELERAVALDATDANAFGYLAELYTLAGRAGDAAWARQQAERWATP